MSSHTLSSGADASGSFGQDTIVQLPNNVPALVNALELILSMPATAPGTENSTWAIKALIAGVQTFIAAFGSSGGFPVLFFGDPANSNGIKIVSATQFQIIRGGTNFVTIDNSTGNSFNVVTSMGSSRFRRAITGSTAVATTITLPSAVSITGGNLFPLTVGTGTLNSITATNFANNDEIKLIVPSGVTITHNVAGSGATILIPIGDSGPGTSIVVSATAGLNPRIIPLYFNGTNFIVEG